MNAWAISGSRRLKYLLLAGDVLLLIAMGFMAASMRNILGGPEAVDVIAGAGAVPMALVILIYVLVFYVFNLYHVGVGRAGIRCLIFLATAILLALFLIAAMLFFISPGAVVVGRTVLISHAAFVGVAVYVWRLVFARSLLPQWARRRVGILSASAEYADLVARLEVAEGVPLEIVHTFGPSTGADEGFTAERVGPTDTLVDGNAPSQETGGGGGIAVQHAVAGPSVASRTRGHLDLLICSIGRSMPDSLVRDAIGLRRYGIEVCDFPSFYSREFGRIPLDAIDAQWILQAIRHRREPAMERLRRVVDVVSSVVLLTLAAPLAVLIAVATKMTSRGPVMFVQERLGLQERPFQCYKFRTMVNDAEAGSGPRWADEADARITRVGSVLRRTRLDELPQLLNVLKGDMSLVGFRPIRRHFADILGRTIPFYHLRFGIKPGLTGWPQVRHNYAGSLEGQREKFEYELFYLANRSLLLDGYIIVKTVQVMLFGRGQ